MRRDAQQSEYAGPFSEREARSRLTQLSDDDIHGSEVMRWSQKVTLDSAAVTLASDVNSTCQKRDVR